MKQQKGSDLETFLKWSKDTLVRQTQTVGFEPETGSEPEKERVVIHLYKKVWIVHTRNEAIQF